MLQGPSSSHCKNRSMKIKWGKWTNKGQAMATPVWSCKKLTFLVKGHGQQTSNFKPRVVQYLSTRSCIYLQLPVFIYNRNIVMSKKNFDGEDLFLSFTASICLPQQENESMLLSCGRVVVITLLRKKEKHCNKKHNNISLSCDCSKLGRKQLKREQVCSCLFAHLLAEHRTSAISANPMIVSGKIIYKKNNCVVCFGNLFWNF